MNILNAIVARIPSLPLPAVWRLAILNRALWDVMRAPGALTFAEATALKPIIEAEVGAIVAARVGAVLAARSAAIS